MDQLLIPYYNTSKYNILLNVTTPFSLHHHHCCCCFYSNRLELFVEPLCSICYHILSKSQLSSPFRQRLIVSLSISTITLKQIWESTTTMTIKRTFGPSVTVLDQFRRGLSLPPHEGQVMLHKLTSFSVLLFVALSSLHDIELFTKGPFTMADMNVITLKLRDVFVNINLNAMQSHLPSLPNDRQVSTAGINAMKFLSNVSTCTCTYTCTCTPTLPLSLYSNYPCGHVERLELV